MNPRKKLSDYEGLAAEHMLEFLEETAPRSINVSVRWKCKRCGRPLKKSWSNLAYKANSCRCWNGIQVSEDEYASAAEKLTKKYGLTITFIKGDYITRNTRQEVDWMIAEVAEIFKASYRELVYNGISLRVQKILREAVDAVTKRSAGKA